MPFLPASIFILCILFGFYTLFSIYKEYNFTPSYRVSWKDSVLAGVEGIWEVPRWWKFDPSEGIFFREDTRYEWYARLERLENRQPSPDLKEEALLFFQKKNLIFDEEEFAVYQDQSESCYVQGTCTLGGEKRCYWEGLFWRKMGKKETYVFYSQSSILNGGIEGPFFAKVVKTLEKSLQLK